MVAATADNWFDGCPLHWAALRPRSAAMVHPGPVLPPSDEQLFADYRRGDPDAFPALYARYRGPILRFIRGIVPQSGLVDEVAQETWLALIEYPAPLPQEPAFARLLYTIARRRSLDRWRRLGRSPPTQSLDAHAEAIAGPDSQLPEAQAAGDELACCLAAALERLPLLQREVFVLRAETSLTIAEIAQVTGVDPETAKSRLRYAVQKLRRDMEGWSGE